MRKKALELFLNDSVTELKLGCYEWKGKYYEVLPYKKILQRGGWSGFVKLYHGNRTLGMRELTEQTLKRYYKAVWAFLLDKQRTVSYNNTMTSEEKTKELDLIDLQQYEAKKAEQEH